LYPYPKVRRVLALIILQWPEETPYYHHY
jgi:hypothetical protein